MVTIRLRSLMWFVAGLTLAIAMLWTSTVWRAEALPGPSESTIVNVTPERVLDSRDPVNLGLNGPFVSQVSQKLQITGSVPTATGTKTVVPTGATGVLLNVTAFNPTANGFIAIRPGNATGAPTTSSLNVEAGQTVPNSVQVSLPTSGSNAGKIDITYDALGQTGPVSDMLIDVVGYTTNTGLQDVNTQLGQKANSSDVYTKTEGDARYQQHGEIVMGYGVNFLENEGSPPTSAARFSNTYRVTSGDGFIQMNLEGPAKIGAVNYGLKSVSYCIRTRTAPAIIDQVAIENHGPTETEEIDAADPTDRSAPGCYTVTVNNKAQTNHVLVIEFGGGGGLIDIRNVTATFAPFADIPKGTPSNSGDSDPAPSKG